MGWLATVLVSIARVAHELHRGSGLAPMVREDRAGKVGADPEVSQRSRPLLRVADRPVVTRRLASMRPASHKKTDSDPDIDIAPDFVFPRINVSSVGEIVQLRDG